MLVKEMFPKLFELLERDDKLLKILTQAMIGDHILSMDEQWVSMELAREIKKLYDKRFK